jgi:hypothetical protein
MGSSTLPKKPVENWGRVRDDWIAAVDQFMSEAEGWAEKQGWAAMKQPKTIVEEHLGSYTVPELVIHPSFGVLTLSPAARFVAGAEGAIDFFVPACKDWVMIARSDDGWHLHSVDSEVPRRAWSEETFVESARRLCGAT